jgi:hypothetical protein
LASLKEKVFFDTLWFLPEFGLLILGDFILERHLFPFTLILLDLVATLCIELAFESEKAGENMFSECFR